MTGGIGTSGKLILTRVGELRLRKVRPHAPCARESFFGKTTPETWKKALAAAIDNKGGRLELKAQEKAIGAPTRKTPLARNQSVCVFIDDTGNTE